MKMINREQELMDDYQECLSELFALEDELASVRVKIEELREDSRHSQGPWIIRLVGPDFEQYNCQEIDRSISEHTVLIECIEIERLRDALIKKEVS